MKKLQMWGKILTERGKERDFLNHNKISSRKPGTVPKRRNFETDTQVVREKVGTCVPKKKLGNSRSRPGRVEILRATISVRSQGNKIIENS